MIVPELILYSTLIFILCFSRGESSSMFTRKVKLRIPPAKIGADDVAERLFPLVLLERNCESYMATERSVMSKSAPFRMTTFRGDPRSPGATSTGDA